MALTLTEKFRASIGGKAWRTYHITQSDGTPLSVTAGSMDLDYIEAIVGCVCKQSLHAAMSLVIEGMAPSIASDNKSIQWTSAGTNMVSTVTLIGW